MRTPEEIADQMAEEGIVIGDRSYVPLDLVREWFKSVTERTTL